MLVFCLLFTIFSLATRAHQDMTDQQVCPYNRDIPITRCLRTLPPFQRMSYLEFLRKGELSMKAVPKDACEQCIQAKFFNTFPSQEQRSWVERGLFMKSKSVFEELLKHFFPPADFATWISTSHQEIRAYIPHSRRDSTQSVWSFLKLMFWWLAFVLGSLVFLVFLVYLYDATRVEPPRVKD